MFHPRRVPGRRAVAGVRRWHGCAHRRDEGNDVLEGHAAMSVIEHDFGSEKRRKTRRFRQLLSLDALHEANVRSNPLPYLERASERIYQLEKTVFEAALAARPPAGGDPEGPVVSVSEAEHRRLLACRAIIDDAFARLEAPAAEDET